RRSRAAFSGQAHTSLEFVRQCLTNLPALVKQTHLLEIHTRETASMLGGQVMRQVGQQAFSILGADLAALLKLHDPSANLPVRGREDAVDGPRRRAAGMLQQLGNAA